MMAYYKVDIFIISLQWNLFSPWYGWTVAHFVLNNNHSLARQIRVHTIILLGKKHSIYVQKM